jgi:hypothetical protein
MAAQVEGGADIELDVCGSVVKICLTLFTSCGIDAFTENREKSDILARRRSVAN